ncbi:MAG: N-acetyltransferase [Muribaculaceae bacterium]|nr:N-acetyltransferase [Muribaculaceae bacterium]MDE6130058.1 N-acetyltransferase [Muribaculaceae bacterium]
MSVTVKEIAPTSEQLRKYVQFGIDLYKGNDCYVPPLIFDEIATLSPEKNPAFDYCSAQSFMAYRDGKPVGRITAIINSAVNNKYGERTMRFGFVDFIDDAEVVDALFKAAEDWGRSRGMNKIVGPMGFTDMDHEGMLTEGFNEMSTMATIYNYPYYPEHMKRMGFGKEVDWVEFRMTVPDAVPEKYQRIADIVARKYKLSVKKYTSRKKIKEEYGHALFQLINEAYDGLYGYSPLTDRQIDYYIDLYLGVIRLEDVCVVVDENGALVAIGISMPSLSQALRRCGGKLFPTGWYHLWKAIRGKVDVVDLLLVAVKPEYQSKGVNALIFADLIPAYIKNGYKYAESNLELEGNESVQKQWEYFERRQHRRRRAWSKNI